MSDNILIGADPEFFLRDIETGQFVSAYGMIEGTKHDPLKVDGGAVQVDGMALEFNIDPAASFEEFDTNILKVLAQLREMIDPRYSFEFVPVAPFGKEYIDAQPDEAKILGCDPDYNAWTSSINPKPNGDLGFRTASGHIHIGWTKEQDITHPEHITACEMAVKQLDITVGLPSLLWDQDVTRRQMYGQFGCYRPKGYGVEYRTLSNVWVNNSRLRRIVYHQAHDSINWLMSGNQYYTHQNPMQIDATFPTNRDVASYVSSSVPLSNGAQPSMSTILKVSTGGSRPKAQEWIHKTQVEGYFYNTKTYELLPWEDVTRDMMRSGEWTTGNIYAKSSKNKGYKKCLNDVEHQAEMIRADKEAASKNADPFREGGIRVGKKRSKVGHPLELQPQAIHAVIDDVVVDQGDIDWLLEMVDNPNN